MLAIAIILDALPGSRQSRPLLTRSCRNAYDARYAGKPRLPPGDRPAGYPSRRVRRPGGDALPPRTERLPAHRTRKVDLHQLRHRHGVRWRLPHAVRRHEPGNRRHEIRRIDPTRRALARVRLEREALLRLGLLRKTVRSGDSPDPGRKGVRGQPERRGDPEG